MKNISISELKNEVYIGDSAVNNLRFILEKHGAINTNIVVMTGEKSFTSSGVNRHIDEVLEQLQLAALRTIRVSSDPKLVDIKSTVRDLLDVDARFILAVGGGSVIDYAKACKHFLSKSLEIFCYYTNIGSGSIASPFMIFDNAEFKVGEYSRDVIPAASYVNRQIIMTNPTSIIGSGVCDIYCHAVEAYLSTVATDGSRKLALKAITYLREYLIKKDVETLLLADIYAILAESVGIVLVPHALGHHVTHQENVRHGYASVVFMRAYFDHLSDGGFQSHKQFQQLLDDIISQYSDYLMMNIQPDLSKANLDRIQKYMGFAIDNSPVPVSRQDLRDIYSASLKRSLT